MTLLVNPPLATSPTMPVAGATPCARGALLQRVFDALEREGIPACVLHGYETIPREVGGDVDCLISSKFFPHRVAQVLHNRRAEIGGKVVQWFEDGAHFVVIAGKNDDGSPNLLQLHVATQYEMAGRVFLTADEVLANRRRRDRFWTPAPEIEFACILCNRIAKASLSAAHARQLSALYAAAPGQCQPWIARFFPAKSDAGMIELAAGADDWSQVQESISALRDSLLANPAVPRAGCAIGRLWKKIARWLQPRNGYHAVFLGPDGVGKSTTIESFQRDLEPAFLHGLYLTFAPGLLPQKFAPPKPAARIRSLQGHCRRRC